MTEGILTVLHLYGSKSFDPSFFRKQPSRDLPVDIMSGVQQRAYGIEMSLIIVFRENGYQVEHHCFICFRGIHIPDIEKSRDQPPRKRDLHIKNSIPHNSLVPKTGKSIDGHLMIGKHPPVIDTPVVAEKFIPEIYDDFPVKLQFAVNTDEHL